jgi:NAD(P)-dependent dehydrogenase (short-subunit alcohol dehydrogenase family)
VLAVKNHSLYSKRKKPGMSRRSVALITGGSRGIGAETALALAEAGCDIVLTYRNKAARAEEVAASIAQSGQKALPLACDITHAKAVAEMIEQVRQWTDHLDIVVLNASGGLERDLVAANPDYPMLINRDAQLALVEEVLPLLRPGSVIVFVTSHWAHLYGQMQQLPAYEPVARSKYAGEMALRALQPDLTTRGVRLIIVTGDLIEGTITPRLLERAAPGLISHRRIAQGDLPTAREMGRVIARSALDPSLPSGSTIVIGASLESMHDNGV